MPYLDQKVLKKIGWSLFARHVAKQKNEIVTKSDISSSIYEKVKQHWLRLSWKKGRL